MSRTSKRFLKAAAAARAAKANKSAEPTQKDSKRAAIEILDSNSDSDGNSDHTEVESKCGWDGDVNQAGESDDDDYSSDSGEELQELEGIELLQSLELCSTKEKELQAASAQYLELLRNVSQKEWEKAETNRGLGYSGLSVRTKRRHNQKAREKEANDAVMRQR